MPLLTAFDRILGLIGIKKKVPLSKMLEEHFFEMLARPGIHRFAAWDLIKGLEDSLGVNGRSKFSNSSMSLIACAVVCATPSLGDPRAAKAVEEFMLKAQDEASKWLDQLTLRDLDEDQNRIAVIFASSLVDRGTNQELYEKCFAFAHFTFPQALGQFSGDFGKLKIDLWN